MKSMFNKMKYLTINTLVFNFQYFTFFKALCFPVFVSSNIVLKKLSGKVIIDAPIICGMIKIGFGDITIFDKQRSRGIWLNEGEIYFNGEAFIGHGSKINCTKTGKIIFGKNFTITAESTIVSNKQIIFGDDCLLSWDILVLDSDFHKILNLNQKVINNPSNITIGNHVWIGCRSIILKGSCVPENSIIAAGSIISKKLSATNSIYSSNSIVPIKVDVSWDI